MELDYSGGNYSTKNLVIFVAVQILNMIALVTDYILLQTESQSITATSIHYPILGMLLCAVQLTQPITLALHFWYAYAGY